MSNPFGTQGEFVEQSFDGMDLRDGNLEGLVFHDCRFTGCTFGGTRFSRCRFIDCTFDRCDLSNAKLAGTAFRTATFHGSKLIGIDWTTCSDLIQPRFQDCVLNYGVFAGRDLRKTSMCSCIAREADFSETNLSESSFDGTDFAAARFRNTNLTKADFRNAISYVISPLDNTLKKTRFSLPEATSLLYGLDIILDD